MKSYSVCDGDRVIAVVVKQSAAPLSGVHFFTPQQTSQQIGYQNRKKGERVQLHEHLPVPEGKSNLGEVLIILQGRARVGIYTEAVEFLHEVELMAGEMVLLEAGAHEIIFEEDTELFEVKRGPYIGAAEKRLLEV